MLSNKIILLIGIIIIGIIVAGILIIYPPNTTQNSSPTSVLSNSLFTTVNYNAGNYNFKNTTIEGTNITILGTSYLDNLLGGNWSFLNQNIASSNFSNGINKVTIYNFTNKTGYNLAVFIVSFNNTENSSNTFDSEMSSIRLTPNISASFGASNSQYAYGIFGGTIGSTTPETLTLGLGQYSKYIISLQLYSASSSSTSLKTSKSKLIEMLNNMEYMPKNLTTLTPSHITINKVKNIFGGNWTIANSSSSSSNIINNTAINIENFTGPSNYSLSFISELFKSPINATNTFNNALNSLTTITGINVINGVLSNGHIVLLASGKLYGNNNKPIILAESVFGNYILEEKISLNSNTLINQNIVSPGLINLLNNMENAQSLTLNSTTTLANQSKLYNLTKPPVNLNKQLFLTTNTLNTTLGNNWKFLNTYNLTYNIPLTSKWIIIENFSNSQNQSLVLEIAKQDNFTATSNSYNVGANVLFGANPLNISVGALYNGSAYSNLSVTTITLASKNFLGYISPVGNYLIELSLSKNSSSNNTNALYSYQIPLKSVLEYVYKNITSSMIINKTNKPVYPTTQELEGLFGGAWNSLSQTNISKTNNGIINAVMENYTSNLGYNVSVIINTMNNSNVANSYYSSTTRYYLTHQITSFGALNTDYAYTISNNQTLSGNSVVNVFGPYGVYFTTISLHSNKNNSTSLETLKNDTIKLLQDTEK